jgi:hypothetical protein
VVWRRNHQRGIIRVAADANVHWRQQQTKKQQMQHHSSSACDADTTHKVHLQSLARSAGETPPAAGKQAAATTHTNITLTAVTLVARR